MFDLRRINFICLAFKAETSLVETDTGGNGSTAFNNASCCKPLACWSFLLVSELHISHCNINVSIKFFLRLQQSVLAELISSGLLRAGQNLG